MDQCTVYLIPNAAILEEFTHHHMTMWTMQAGSIKSERNNIDDGKKDQDAFWIVASFSFPTQSRQEGDKTPQPRKDRSLHQFSSQSLSSVDLITRSFTKATSPGVVKLPGLDIRYQFQHFELS